MKSKIPVILFISLLVLILSGCVGKREINELALVMAVGIDKGSKEDSVKITAQIARPADARGQTGAPSGNTGDPIWSAEAEGATIFEAIRNLSTFTSRRVFWAHNFIIVINEEVARDGIADIIDFFTRNPELRMNTWVVVSSDKASDIVSTMTGLEVIPGEALDKLFRYSRISSQAPRTHMIDLQSAYLNKTAEPILARVQIVEKGVSNQKPGQNGSVKQVELKGTGVLKGDKLLGFLDGNETMGLLPFIEPVESWVVPLKCPNDDKKNLSLELRHQDFKVTPSYKEGRPVFDVKMKSYTSVVEAGCSFTLKDREQVKLLEKKAEELLNKQLRTVVDKVQNQFKSDILELGNVFNNRYPAEWKNYKGRWDEGLQSAKVNIQVDVKIKESVLLYKPTKHE